MHPRTREWLKAELDKQQTAWEAPVLHNPFAHDNSCMGLINAAKDFYEEKQDYHDLMLWDRAVKKAESYLQEKARKYKQTPEYQKNPVAGAAELDKKNEERDAEIARQSKAIKWEKFRKAQDTVRQRKTVYEQNKTQENLTLWQTDLHHLVAFVEQHYGLQTIEQFRLDFDAAQRAYEKKRSIVSKAEAYAEKANGFCFKLFPCCYKEEEVEIENQIQGHVPGPVYNQMP